MVDFWRTDRNKQGLWVATGGDPKERQVMGYTQFAYSSRAKKATMLSCFGMDEAVEV